MDFTVDTQTFLNATERLANLASKGKRKTISNDQISGVLKITVNETQAILTSTNGFIVGKHIIDGEPIKITEQGTACVDASLLSRIVDAVPKEAGTIKISSTPEKILVTAKGGSKSIKTSAPILLEVPDFEFVAVKTKKAFKVDPVAFRVGIGAVSPLAAIEEYDPRYKMMFVDFLKSETRFVCGDGPRWGVVCHKNDINELLFKDQAEDQPQNSGHIIPAEQAMVLKDLFDAQNGPIEIRFGKDKYQFVSDFGFEAVLLGVPCDAYGDYVPYTMQTERKATALFSIEVSREEFAGFVKMLVATKDAEMEKKSILSLTWMINDKSLKFKIPGDREVDWETYNVKYEGPSPCPEFNDDFSLRFFPEVLKIGHGNSIKFSFMGAKDVVFADIISENGAEYELLFSPMVSEE